MLAGLCWLIPGLLKPTGWDTRNFTLSTRLLTELRVVTAYIGWTLLPTPGALSFYHDNWTISTGLFAPWTTFGGLCALIVLGALGVLARHRFPLVSLGIALFFSAQALTGTILPLELVYEHRNYFASMALLLCVVPLLASPVLPLRIVRNALLALLALQSAGVLYITAREWNSPLSLARELADRAPDSPRAQYELGRTYIILSHYDVSSPFTPKVYPPLEAAARIPGSSILPEQALIFFNARAHLPLKDAWWDSMTHKLATQKVTIQDESALGSLTQCTRDGMCALPADRMMNAFLAAIGHGAPSPRLHAMYADFAWNILQDKALGLRMARQAMAGKPSEAAYRITVIRMLIATGQKDEAREVLQGLARMNIGGSLNSDLASLRPLLDH